MRKRFDYITDVARLDFGPIYIVATALYPRFQLVLSDNQLATAKIDMLRLVRIFRYFFLYAIENSIVLAWY